VVVNMNIATNLNGRLRNTSLPLSCGLLPLFETVINAIHALEEANIPAESGWIRVVIERDVVHSLLDTVEGKKSGRQPLNDIASFTVTDNGVGFNDENFNAFLTLDTDHKIDKGGRGIGRLLWLKAFQRVDVASMFLDGGVLRQRVFQFSTAGVTGEDVTGGTNGCKDPDNRQSSGLRCAIPNEDAEDGGGHRQGHVGALPLAFRARGRVSAHRTGRRRRADSSRRGIRPTHALVSR